MPRPRSSLPLPRACGDLVLRRLRPSDLADFQSYRTDPAVGRFQGWSPLPDAQALECLQAFGSGALLQPGCWSQLAIAGAADDRLLGDIGILVSEDRRQAEIGFTLSPASQGRGLATRAVREAIELVFERTPVQRIVAVTDERNAPSIRLLERIGMQRADSAATVFRGEPCIEHTYVLTGRQRGSG